MSPERRGRVGTAHPTPPRRSGAKPAKTRDRSAFPILDALIETIEAAKPMPMSGAALVNRAEILEALTDLRAALPGQLADAERLLADADHVVASAQQEADAIRRDAKAEAVRLVGEHAITRQARAQAEATIDQAAADARTRAAASSAEQDARLAAFETDLGHILAAVQTARSRAQADLAAPPDPSQGEP